MQTLTKWQLQSVNLEKRHYMMQAVLWSYSHPRVTQSGSEWRTRLLDDEKAKNELSSNNNWLASWSLTRLRVARLGSDECCCRTLPSGQMPPPTPSPFFSFVVRNIHEKVRIMFVIHWSTELKHTTSTNVKRWVYQENVLFYLSRFESTVCGWLSLQFDNQLRQHNRIQHSYT